MEIALRTPKIRNMTVFWLFDKYAYIEENVFGKLRRLEITNPNSNTRNKKHVITTHY